MFIILVIIGEEKLPETFWEYLYLYKKEPIEALEKIIDIRELCDYII